MTGRIKGITVVIGGDTTGLDKALKNINSGISKTQSALKDVQKLLKLDPSNTTLLAQKQEYLKSAIEQTKEKLEALKTAQVQAKEQLESGTLGKDKYEALEREIIATQEDLEKLENQAEKSETSLEKLGNFGEKISGFGEGVSDFGKKLTPVSAAVGAIGTASMAAWHQMDDAYDGITAKTGATGKQAEDLQQTFQKVFSSMPVESQAASDAIAGISTRLGLTGKSLQDTTEQFLKFAEVNDTDVASAVDTVTGAMNDAGISADQAGSVLDALTAASQQSGISVDELAKSLDQNGVTMRQLGMSTSDSIALFATLSKNGVEASDVMTGLSYAAKTYGKAGQDASVEIQKLFEGIKNGSASAADAQEAFGSRAGQALYEYIKEGKLDYQDLANSIKNSSGTVSETFENMEDPIDKMKVAFNNLKLAGASMGDSLNTVLAPVFDAMAAGAQDLSKVILNLPSPLKDTAAAIGVMITALGPGTIAVGEFISKFGESVKSIADFGQSLLELKDKITGVVDGIQVMPSILSALTSPVGIAVAAIAGLVAVFATLWNTSDQFRTTMTGIWDQITASVSSFVQSISADFSGLTPIFSGLTSALSTIWTGFCQILAPVFEAAFGYIATVLQGTLQMITGILNTFIGLFSGNWKKMWNGLKDVVDGFFKVQLGSISSSLNSIATSLTQAGSKYLSSWKSSWNSMETAFKTTITSIQNNCKTALNKMSSDIQSVMNSTSKTFTSIWNSIKSSTSSVLSSISSDVSAKWSQIKSNTSSTFSAIQSACTSAWNSIKSAISSAASSIYSAVSSKFQSLKSSVSSAFSALLGNATATWNSIKQAIITPIQNAYNAIAGLVQRMESVFNGMHLSFPHIPLPHLAVSGSFSINPPSVPHFGLSWYKLGGILTGPTIFGMQGSTLLAGGEAGREAVLPLDSFYSELEKILSKGDNSKVEDLLGVIAQNSAKVICLDGQALVGYLLPDIDEGLGKAHMLQRRIAV